MKKLHHRCYGKKRGGRTSCSRMGVMKIGEAWYCRYHAEKKGYEVPPPRNEDLEVLQDILPALTMPISEEVLLATQIR